MDTYKFSHCVPIVLQMFKANIWAGVLSDYLIRPNFLTERLNIYLTVLENIVPEFLQHVRTNGFKGFQRNKSSLSPVFTLH